MRYSLLLCTLLFAAADVSAQDAGSPDSEDAGAEQADAGKITRPGAGEENKRLIDKYTSDHGCSCQAVAAASGTRGWLSVLGLSGAALWRIRRQSRRF